MRRRWMDRSSIAIGIVVLTIAAGAHAERQAAIGDSISVSFDSNDQGCNTTISCALRLGADSDYSWTTGTYGSSLSGSSMRSHWANSGLIPFSTAPNMQQIIGKTWSDAARQAGNIGSDVTRTTIEMGGNDVCQALGNTIPTKAQIDAYIQSTFSKLVTNMASGGKVVVAAVPNITNLRNTMVNQAHFAFHSCQDLWNFDTTRLHVTLVPAVGGTGGWCQQNFFTSGLCNLANWGATQINNFASAFMSDFGTALRNAIALIWPQAAQSPFPCGVMLNSSASPTARALATQLNTDINAALAAEVTAYNASQSKIRFYYVPDTGNYQFSAGDVSSLDCFHPNRQGQANIGSMVWTSLNNQVYAQSTTPPNTQNITAPALTAASGTGSAGQWSSWWTAPAAGDHQINTQFNATKGARIKVYLENCWNSASPYYSPVYIGTTTNENPNTAGFGVHGITDAMYNDWWSTDVVMIDSANNTSAFKYSPSGNPNANGSTTGSTRWCI